MKLTLILLPLMFLVGCSTKVENEDHRLAEQAKMKKIQEKEVARQKKESEDLERQKYYDSRFRKYENN